MIEISYFLKDYSTSRNFKTQETIKYTNKESYELFCKDFKRFNLRTYKLKKKVNEFQEAHYTSIKQIFFMWELDNMQGYPFQILDIEEETETLKLKIWEEHYYLYLKNNNLLDTNETQEHLKNKIYNIEFQEILKLGYFSIVNFFDTGDYNLVGDYNA